MGSFTPNSISTFGLACVPARADTVSSAPSTHAAARPIALILPPSQAPDDSAAAASARAQADHDQAHVWRQRAVEGGRVLVRQRDAQAHALARARRERAGEVREP